MCLGAKTTCKDRWRQVLNEADNVPVKHLFTLQQGISRNQLSEMYHENVCLVVPAQYLNSFDKEFQSRIMTLSGLLLLLRKNKINHLRKAMAVLQLSETLLPEVYRVCK